MNGFMSVLLDIFRQPSVIVALISLIGLWVQHKKATDIMQGTIRTMVGFLVLTSGTTVISNSLAPFGDMFKHAFHVQGVVPSNEAVVGMVLVKYGSEAALIFFFGMIVNILLSMTSRFKYIYLSGHVAFYMATMIAVIFEVSGLPTWGVLVWGSIAQGLIVTVSPALVQPFMRDVTGSDEVAFGHTSGSSVALGGLIARLTRSKKHPSKSTEDIKFPKGLSFLRDTTVIVALSMMLIYVVVALCAGPTYIQAKLSNGQNFIVFALLQGATFSAGVFIILAGVRVVLNEIVPAFKGISEKLVKNAKPALDVPVTFTFAPNAVMIGFISCFIGAIVGMLIMIACHTTIVIPGVVSCFMTGAAAAVIGNSQSGVRGAVISSFVSGIAISFIPLFLLPVLGSVGLANVTYSGPDFGVAGLIFGYANKFGGQVALIVTVILSVVLFYIASVLLTRREKAKKAGVDSADADGAAVTNA
ncbi:PTS ascorbate transporter subunit IIC [Bifidobacterium sp. ESL0769]|uniref:PTS ascorbate transporter subunit IIC n=1 Tax=Bifidobacterium sp. ESL0769 TaxID=2983229 RepID=UPI0023F9CA19|nr:PTS ascorbate transporter subunit IIC [Bifidobacterium sp. ESL0769]WEV67627.1 PTS ascorbate transporter subunit IIC [Bifidobacterium sp. ESL0769]